MAKDVRQRTTWGNRFRFLSRFLGLTGAAAAVVGVTLAATAFAVPDSFPAAWATGRAAAEGANGPFPQAAVITLAAGLALAAFALVVELAGALFLVTGRRSGAGAVSAVGVSAAVALFVVVNVYSFGHYRRVDLTRDRQFTLPPPVADELRKLSPDQPTTIVVLQQHKTFGRLTEKADGYDSAAERKVVEKVGDLVDQFREFGPRFRVVVLDVNGKRYDKELAELTKDAPELKAAIDAAPESSIFFQAGNRVQRLAFHEFLQLDKTASKEAHAGRGNLVLLPQGVDSFARRVLAVQERRPKIAVAVVHELLTSKAEEGLDEYTLSGMRKALTEAGFDVVDVVLKKNWESRQGELEPAAYTLDESKLERVESELADVDERLEAARQEVRTWAEVRKVVDSVKGKPWPDRAAAYRRLVRGNLTEELEPELLTTLKRQTERADQRLADLAKERATAEAALVAVYKEERTTQDRRMTDVRAKFAKLLSDVDLLIVPRVTTNAATLGPMVPARLHGFSKEQAEVVKDFMKAGKPVLATLGTISEEGGPAADAVDDFEKLLAERGVELGKQTVLFNVEGKAFANRRAGNMLGGAVEVPPLVVAGGAVGAAGPNPVGEALRLTARSVDQKLDVRLRALRPVYLARGWESKVPFAAEFVTTSPDAWNEERPFAQRRPLAPGVDAITYLPKFEPAGLDDPKRGTRDEERQGPFPVGVAIEAKVPADWLDPEFTHQRAAAALAAALPGGGLDAALLTAVSSQQAAPTSRLVVLGHGGVFTGMELKPAPEKLLVHSVNWLLGRGDRLPKADQPAWSYPRVELSDRELFLWRWGTFLGLPLLALYLGLVVLMVRKVR